MKVVLQFWATNLQATWQISRMSRTDAFMSLKAHYFKRLLFDQYHENLSLCSWTGCKATGQWSIKKKKVKILCEVYYIHVPSKIITPNYYIW